MLEYAQAEKETDQMSFTRKRKIAAAAAGITVLAAAGGAYAATQGSGNDQQAVIADAAKRLGVSPDRLESALQRALADRLDAAVAAGRLTRAQADAIKQRLNRDALPLLGGPGRFHRHLAPFADAAAKYIGITPAQLRGEVEAAKSLATVATKHHKSVAGLEQAIEADARTRLDGAVAAKRISAAQEQQILAGLRARIGALVNRTGPPGHGHIGRWGAGPPPGAGFDGGPPPGPGLDGASGPGAGFDGGPPPGPGLDGAPGPGAGFDGPPPPAQQ